MPVALCFSEKHGPRMFMQSEISVKDKTRVLLPQNLAVKESSLNRNTLDLRTGVREL